MSMVDQHLLYALLVAVPVGTKLILVGDVNQLPSVGPGSVLKDIISSGCCSVVRLTRIFRQAQESDIVVNAHRINRGEHMSLDNKSKDFFFLRRQDANRIISNAITLVQDKLPRYVGAGWRDIQILTPTRKGLLGVERLNGILQTYLNPADRSKREYAYGDHLLREGDKVMQIRNNYQAVWSIRGRYGVEISRGTGIFNGDIGTVDSIDEMGRILTVEFDDGRMVEYPFENLDELELAYAVTIHKSQGSEYPAVVIPLLAGPQMLMNRNLLYTAVTRAKKCVVLVGDEEVFFRMIDNTAEQKRWTTLAERLKELEHGREEEQEELGEEE
jgi:exodeoxyribonuclease V alpha subunit